MHSKNKVRLFLLLLLIGSLVLAACGGGATPTATSAPPTDEPTSVPTDEETEVAQAATDIPPTETPTEEPTVVPTEIPPTETPTEEPTAIPTEVPPTATDVPTEAPTVEETEAVVEVTEVATETGPQTIVGVADSTDGFSVLVSAVKSAGLVDTLNAEGPFTVFAPTDAAFRDAFKALGMRPRALFNNKELLTSILTYHVVAGKVSVEDVMAMDGQEVETLNGATIKISVKDGKVFLNDTVEVTMTDIEASNGVIHVISAVLVPPAPEVGQPQAESTPEATPESSSQPSVSPSNETGGPTVVIAPDEPVKVGLSAAFSGEGLAPFGIDIRRGAELALEDRPTVTVGGTEFTVALDPQDDLCSPEGGQTVANRFVSDQSIVAVIGPMCSSGAAAAIPIFDTASYSAVSPSATAATLTDNNTSFSRTVSSDKQQGQAAANFIYNALGFRRIAVVDDGSTYGEGLVNVVIAEFEALGGEIVARDAVTVGETDFRPLLESIASAEPELIYFGGFPAEGARLVEQRADVGLENIQFMGADGIFGPEFINLAGSSANGVIASHSIPVSSDAVTAFRERFVATYNEEPASSYNTNTYDALNLILNAVEAVGTLDADGNLVIERVALGDYIRNAKLSGLTGEFDCGGTGECATASIGFSQVVDGVYAEYEAP